MLDFFHHSSRISVRVTLIKNSDAKFSVWRTVFFCETLKNLLRQTKKIESLIESIHESIKFMKSDHLQILQAITCTQDISKQIAFNTCKLLPKTTFYAITPQKLLHSSCVCFLELFLICVLLNIFVFSVCIFFFFSYDMQVFLTTNSFFYSWHLNPRYSW